MKRLENRKAEALAAINEAYDILSAGKPLSELTRVTLIATLGYAMQKVGAIQELTRVRKPKGPAAEA